MDIKVKGEVVGSLYVNIQLPSESFGGKSLAEITDLIKGSNGQDQQSFELEDIGSFKIESFRRLYNDDEKVCVEGAKLVKV